MGNQYSSALRASRRKELRKAPALPKYIAVVVVAGDGARTVEIEVPFTQASMKVGELLLEFPPAHFIAHFDRSSLLLQRPASMAASSSAQFQERSSPLGADADAMPGAEDVYVLLPMHRLHTRLTCQEHLILARLLADNVDTIAQQQQHVIEEKCGVEVRPRCSCTKRVMCSLRWGRRRAAARVAPHVDIIHVHDDDDDDDDEQEDKRSSLMMEIEGEVACEEMEDELPNLMEKQAMMMIKAKPWAPKLETITEAHEQQ